MDYMTENKAAWEEAFAHRQPHWGENVAERLSHERLPFLDAAVVNQIQTLDFKGKVIAQFCCNNGRELLSLMQLGPAKGIGFDIATNIIDQARQQAQTAKMTNCEFVAVNILDIPDSYHQQFDFIIFTIGAITWFKDLEPLFAKVAACLKPGGQLLLHDFHPFMNMLPLPDEPDFNAQDLQHLSYPYFNPDPFIEGNGMSYLSEPYQAKNRFISFAHPTAAIINHVLDAGLALTRFDEYDYDVGLSDVYDGRGYPLSFLLMAQKTLPT
ncbi:class I SAM-dependent methyltransferase [Lacticaseibacillus brantae]|uniref:Methyltransferase domain-containing protein n=1 Tax=Lacticaseibacillus brantae DSM 23927 TaxID=1423727 RepID=A0A0R2AWC9_9LACO|nr:class I SAM-dependent methyltransferase [Lacticaseibacillus brantae]KRM71287.1 hypothetical protein FC34_GL001766 [Lacticaseibacillus brantae DSM 23927]